MPEVNMWSDGKNLVPSFPVNREIPGNIFPKQNAFSVFISYPRLYIRWALL